MKWRNASSVICDRKVPKTIRGMFYRKTIRLVMFYGIENWIVKWQQVHKYGKDDNFALDEWAYKKW